MHFNFLIVKTPAGDDVFFYLFLKIQYFNNIMIWDIGGLPYLAKKGPHVMGHTYNPWPLSFKHFFLVSFFLMAGLC